MKMYLLARALSIAIVIIARHCSHQLRARLRSIN